jgi:hypothetical protein
MSPLDWIVLTLLTAGGWMLVTSLMSLRRMRLLVAGLRGTGALALLGLGMVFVLVASNLATYHRLTQEQDVLTIMFTRLGPQQYLARLSFEDGRTASYEVNGDEWQVDARVLKWQSYAHLLGMEPQYRLERLSGRYLDPASGQSVTSHELARDQGLDLWRLIRNYSLPLADTLYGSAVYLPMADRAEFSVSIAPAGLVARPVNERAETALRQW